MKVVKQRHDIIGDLSSERPFLSRVANAARTCYKSEPVGLAPEEKEELDRKLVRRLIENGHEAMLEHAWLTVIFVTDRAVANELVRHRLSSFAQESSRYVNYAKDKFGSEIQVIAPVGLDISSKAGQCWATACMEAEREYMAMLEAGATTEEARDILPLCTKTEIVVTTNLREWRHILNLRAAGATGKPHPKMKALMTPLLVELEEKLPTFFGDILVGV